MGRFIVPLPEFRVSGVHHANPGLGSEMVRIDEALAIIE